MGDDFESTNATVESIDIKVSGNMITATFANVPVEHDVTTEMVSGTIVAKEQ